MRLGAIHICTYIHLIKAYCSTESDAFIPKVSVLIASTEEPVSMLSVSEATLVEGTLRRLPCSMAYTPITGEENCLRHTSCPAHTAHYHISVCSSSTHAPQLQVWLKERYNIRSTLDHKEHQFTINHPAKHHKRPQFQWSQRITTEHLCKNLTQFLLLHNSN